MDNISNEDRSLALQWWRAKTQEEQIKILRKSNLIGSQDRLPKWLTGSEIQKLYETFK
jgi:hypothetical protein